MQSGARCKFSKFSFIRENGFQRWHHWLANVDSQYSLSCPQIESQIIKEKRKREMLDLLCRANRPRINYPLVLPRQAKIVTYFKGNHSVINLDFLSSFNNEMLGGGWSIHFLHSECLCIDHKFARKYSKIYRERFLKHFHANLRLRRIF